MLGARRQVLEEERDRLVSAIAMGKGAAKTLVAELEKRETELEAPLGGERAKSRAAMRDHFSDIKNLVADGDAVGAETEPCELVVPGGELPPTFMPLGGELRPSQIAEAKRGATKLPWRPYVDEFRTAVMAVAE